MTVLAVLPWTSPATDGARTAPMNRPSQKPPNDSTWVAAPSRSPWTADRPTSTTSTQSTQFTA